MPSEHRPDTAEDSSKAGTTRVCRTGETIYIAGSIGSAWRVSSGSVRLDRQTPKGETIFASLAIRGDVIGAETMLLAAYSFTATALGPCTLTPWPDAEGGAAVSSDLLRTLIVAERRAAEVVALRYGQAAERVKRLVLMLAAPGTGSTGLAFKSDLNLLQVTLPPRQDMADITALTLETVSRMISGLRRSGVLNPLSANGSACNSRFSLTILATKATGSGWKGGQPNRVSTE